MAGADKFIGKTFYAKESRTRFRYPGDFKTTFPGEKKLLVYKPGDLIGVVYSWLEKDGKLYWMFLNSQGKAYYIQHKEGAIQLTQQLKNVIKVAEAKEKAETDAALQQSQEIMKEAKGDFAFYFEKYGKVVLGVIVGTILLKTIIEKKL